MYIQFSIDQPKHPFFVFVVLTHVHKVFHKPTPQGKLSVNAKNVPADAHDRAPIHLEKSQMVGDVFSAVDRKGRQLLKRRTEKCSVRVHSPPHLQINSEGVTIGIRGDTISNCCHFGNKSSLCDIVSGAFLPQCGRALGNSPNICGENRT